MSASLTDARTQHLARADRQKAVAARWLRHGLAAGIAALALRSFVFEPVNIPSESMLPGLIVGDYLLVAKWPYGYGRFTLPVPLPVGDGRLRLAGLATALPARGDIIVFKTPRDNRTDYIKRVIGLPGDRVALAGGRVQLNGAAIAGAPLLATLPAGEAGCSRACSVPGHAESLAGGPHWTVIDRGGPGGGSGARRDFAEAIVPAGHVFVLGDNRDDSADSRFSVAEGGVGMVPIANIIGRADIIFFSLSNGGLRPDRIGTRL